MATKRDLDGIAGRMDRLEGRMDAFERRLSDGFDQMHRDLRLQLYRLLGFFVAPVGVVVTVTG